MKIAIVDGYSTARFLVGELTGRGADCLHLRSQEHPPAVYARAFDATTYREDFGWFARASHAAAALAEAGVDRVVAGTESGVLLADELNHLLGLPGNAPETAEARRDKAAMAKALRAAGITAVEDTEVATAEEGLAWFHGRGGRPVVVKPRASAGSDNVWVCHTAEQVTAACRKVLADTDFFGTPNHTALVQEYLDGPECHADSASLDGEHKIAEVWRSTRLPQGNGAFVYDYEEPLQADDPIAVRISAYVKDVLTALGIRNAAGHSELRITERGPVLLETGARLIGGILPHVAEEQSGVSHVSLLTDTLVDHAAFAAFDDTAVRWAKPVRWVSLISDRAGTATTDTWRETLTQLPTFQGLVSRIGPGKPVPATVDLASSPGFVYLVGERHEDVVRDYEALRAAEKEGFYLS